MNKKSELLGSAVLGEKILMLRKIGNVTQMELAQALQYNSSGTISLIESGHRGMSNKKIFQAAEFFNVPPLVLMTPRRFNEQQLRIIVNLMTVLTKAPDSPHLQTVNSLLEFIVKDLES